MKKKITYSLLSLSIFISLILIYFIQNNNKYIIKKIYYNQSFKEIKYNKLFDSKKDILSSTVYIKTPTNLRMGPLDTYEVINHLKINDTISIESIVNDWLYVKYLDNYGYIKKDTISNFQLLNYNKQLKNSFGPKISMRNVAKSSDIPDKFKIPFNEAINIIEQNKNNYSSIELSIPYKFKSKKEAKKFIEIMRNSKYFQFTSGFIAKVEGDIVNKYNVVIFIKETILNYYKNQEVINMMDNIIKDIISPDMTEKEAIIAINQFIVDYTDYDLDYINVYDLLKYGKGRCTAYSLAFMALAERIGIKTNIVVGSVNGYTSGNHAWNIIYLSDGVYFNDSTFNDSEIQNQFLLLDKDNFMKDREEFFIIDKFPFFSN